MPIYEYKCLKCGYKFEKLILGEKKANCPKCQSNSLEKMISNFCSTKISGSCGNSCKGNCSSCNK